MWFIELEESTWKELMDFESVSIGFFSCLWHLKKISVKIRKLQK